MEIVFSTMRKQWCLNLVSVDSGIHELYYKVRVSWKIINPADFSAYSVFSSLKCLEVRKSRKIINHCSTALLGYILSSWYRFKLLFLMVCMVCFSFFVLFFNVGLPSGGWFGDLHF